jgi:MFS family permease
MVVMWDGPFEPYLEVAEGPPVTAARDRLLKETAMTTQPIPAQAGLIARRVALTERLSTPVELINTPGFLRLVLSNALSHSFGMRMQGITIAWVVLEMTGSKIWLGIVNGAPAISIVLFSLFAGVLADSRDSRRVLTAIRAALATTAFIAAVLTFAGQVRVEHLVLYALIVMGLSAMDMPLGRTLTLQVVGPARLMNANAMQTMVMNVISVVTPISIAAVIGLAGSGAAFLLLAAGYVLGALLMLTTRVSPPPSSRGVSTLSDLAAGVAYIRTSPKIRGLVILGFLMPFVGVYFALVPVFAREVLDVGASGLGLLVGSFSLGSLVGSMRLVAGGPMSRRGRRVIFLSLAFGAGMVAFGLSQNLLLSCAISVSMGFMGVYWQNLLTTMVQTESAPEMRGRALSLFTMGFQLASLGWLIGGVTASLVGPEAALIVSGGCFAGLSSLVLACNREARLID